MKNLRYFGHLKEGRSYWNPYLKSKLAFTIHEFTDVIIHHRFAGILFFGSVMLPPELLLEFYKRLIDYHPLPWLVLELLSLVFIFSTQIIFNFSAPLESYEKSLPIPLVFRHLSLYLQSLLLHLPLALVILFLHFSSRSQVKFYSAGKTEIVLTLAFLLMGLVNPIVLFIFKGDFKDKDRVEKREKDKVKVKYMINGRSSTNSISMKLKILLKFEPEKIAMSFIGSVLILLAAWYILNFRPEIPKPRGFLAHFFGCFLVGLFTRHFQTFHILDQRIRLYLQTLPLRKGELFFINALSTLTLILPLLLILIFISRAVEFQVLLLVDLVILSFFSFYLRITNQRLYLILWLFLSLFTGAIYQWAIGVL